MLAGCQPADVVFTSGGTEGNNLVMAQFDHVITSAIEHDSIRHAHDCCTIIAVDENGIVDLDHLAATLSRIDEAAKPNTIISVMAANNETGVIQPIDQIAEMAASSSIAFHSDMVQIFGKNHLDFSSSKISYASISAHKIGGPAGVGALLARPGCRLTSLLRGGGQEQDGDQVQKICWALLVSAPRHQMPLVILIIMIKWGHGGMILKPVCLMNAKVSRCLANLLHGLVILAVSPLLEKLLKP